MVKSALTPQHFVNPASAEQLARNILSDASFVWQTELWLDPIEHAKLAGEKLTRDQERVVARELLKTSARVDDMLVSLIDLYQMYDDTGAVKGDYDAACKMLHTRRKPLSFGKIWQEGEAHLPEILADHGFSQDLYKTLMNAARGIGVVFDDVEFTADNQGIAILGEHPHRVLRDAVQTFPRVDGNTFIREGLLQTYSFGKKRDKAKGKMCTTDSYQALLALAKYGSEQYRARVRKAISSGLTPFKSGVAWFVVILIIVAIAAAAAVIVTLLCTARRIKQNVCNIALTILGFIVTIGICALVKEGSDDSFECLLTTTGTDA